MLEASSTSKVTETRSFCRLCPALCGIVVQVQDGAAVGITGDRQHPISRGYTCPKGRKLIAMASDGARLDYPLVRNNAGELVRTSWGTALDDLAERLGIIAERHGGEAIGSYVGTAGAFDRGGSLLGGQLLGALSSPSRYTSLTVDSVAKVLVPKLLTGGEERVPYLMYALDLDRTTFLLVIGQNTVVSHGAFSYLPDPIRYLRAIKERGELWVLDPRHTETARLASRHLTPRAGTDHIVLGHVVRELLVEGADRVYLEEHARSVDSLKDAVAPLDVATTSARTGVRPEDLTELVNAIRRHRRVAILTGTGVTMAAVANVTEWLAWAIQIITGSFERPGGRWFNHGAAYWPSQQAATIVPPHPGPRSRPDLPYIAGQYPCAAMHSEIEQGYLHAMLVFGGNVMTALPQPDRLAKALRQLDAFAVWDIVPTATLELATHVFPSTDPLERADVHAATHLSAVSAQYTTAVVEARGERRPMWWSIASLAERMGLSLLPGGRRADDCVDEDVFEQVARSLPGGWDALRSADGPLLFTPEPAWVVRTVLPGGRWDVAPAPLVEQFRQALDPPRHDLVLLNRREMRHTNSTFTGGFAQSREQPAIYINPLDAAEREIADGDTVEVASAHGAVIAGAHLDAALARGTVSIPHGFQDANVGHLTTADGDVDPLSGMVTQIGIPLTLRQVTE